VTDDEFLAGVEAAARGAPPDGFRFGHREHLRLTWVHHERFGREAGGEATVTTLRRLDGAHGGGRYHETITRFWLGLVWHAGRRFTGRSFESLLVEHPPLLDRTALSRHYSPGLLASAEARRREVPPDLEPFPWDPHAV
jgi:hypothetical protein